MSRKTQKLASLEVRDLVNFRMESLPYPARVRIFEALKRTSSRPRKLKFFYPNCHFHEVAQSSGSGADPDDLLRFCLIYPSFLSKIKVDTASCSFDTLFLLSHFDDFTESAEESMAKRIRLKAELFLHFEDEFGKWIILETPICDVLQSLNTIKASDWVFRKGFFTEIIRQIFESQVCDIKASFWIWKHVISNLYTSFLKIHELIHLTNCR